jgi:hypothetical protein
MTKAEWERRVQALEEAARRAQPVGEFLVLNDPECEETLAPYRRNLNPLETYEILPGPQAETGMRPKLQCAVSPPTTS